MNFLVPKILIIGIIIALVFFTKNNSWHDFFLKLYVWVFRFYQIVFFIPINLNWWMSSLPKDSFSTPQNGRKNIAHFLCHIAKIPALPRSETQSFLRKKQKKIPSKQSIHLSDGTCKLDRFLISIITHVMVICSSGDPPLRKLGYCLRWKDVCKKQRKKKSERITRLGKIRCKVIRGWIFFSFIFFSKMYVYRKSLSSSLHGPKWYRTFAHHGKPENGRITT